MIVEILYNKVKVKKNNKVMVKIYKSKGYELIYGETDKHLFFIELRNKDITGKDAEDALDKAHITVNKNMVPFDDKSPFVTSGIRVGTAAVTTRGLKEEDMGKIVDLIDEVLMNIGKIGRAHV